MYYQLVFTTGSSFYMVWKSRLLAVSINPCTIYSTGENQKYLLPFCIILVNLATSVMLMVPGISIVFAKASIG